MGDVCLTEPPVTLGHPRVCSLTLAQGALPVLTSFFSRTRGTKMNTKKSEPKQRADTTAILLSQQQPHMKVVEPKF